MSEKFAILTFFTSGILVCKFVVNEVLRELFILAQIRLTHKTSKIMEK